MFGEHGCSVNRGCSLNRIGRGAGRGFRRSRFLHGICCAIFVADRLERLRRPASRMDETEGHPTSVTLRCCARAPVSPRRAVISTGYAQAGGPVTGTRQPKPRAFRIAHLPLVDGPFDPGSQQLDVRSRRRAGQRNPRDIRRHLWITLCRGWGERGVLLWTWVGRRVHDGARRCRRPSLTCSNEVASMWRTRSWRLP